MNCEPQQFEVVFQAPGGREGIVLQSAADANEATTAFHDVLRRLSIQRVAGEVLVRNRRDADHPLLRLPLQHHNG